MAAAKISRKGALLPIYRGILFDPQSKKRYEDKLALLGGKDPYDISPEAGKDMKDDVGLWTR